MQILPLPHEKVPPIYERNHQRMQKLLLIVIVHPDTSRIQMPPLLLLRPQTSKLQPLHVPKLLNKLNLKLKLHLKLQLQELQVSLQPQTQRPSLHSTRQSRCVPPPRCCWSTQSSGKCSAKPLQHRGRVCLRTSTRSIMHIPRLFGTPSQPTSATQSLTLSTKTPITLINLLPTTVWIQMEISAHNRTQPSRRN